MTRVVFLLVPDVHLLDLAGPAQVFHTAANLGLDYRSVFVAERPAVTAAQGLTLLAEVEWPTLTRTTWCWYPGWRSPGLRGTGALEPSSSTGWSTTIARAARWAASAPGPTLSAGPGC